MSEELQADAPEPSDDFQLELDGLEVSDTDELTTDVNRIVDEIRENQGVNRDIALSIEAVQPGSISGRVPINSFTRDYTRTNYQVTTEVIAEMSGVAMVGVAVAAAVVAVMLGAWIYKTFFGGKEKGSGGARDKAIQSAMENNKEFKKDVEAAAKILAKHKKDITEKEKQELIDQCAENMYKGIWKNKYSELIEELGEGKGNHLALVNEIVSKLPGWMDQLEKAEEGLLGKVHSGKAEGINAADYSITIEVNGINKNEIDGKLPALKDAYSKKATPDPNRTPKTDIDFSRAVGIGAAIDKLTEEDVKKFQEFAEKAKKIAEGMKTDQEEAKKWNDAAFSAQKLIRERVKRIGELWSILGMIQKAHTAIAEAMCNQTASRVEGITSMLEKASKDLEGSELEQATSLVARLKTMLGKQTKFVASTKKIGDEEKEEPEAKK